MLAVLLAHKYLILTIVLATILRVEVDEKHGKVYDAGGLIKPTIYIDFVQLHKFVCLISINLSNVIATTSECLQSLSRRRKYSLINIHLKKFHCHSSCLFIFMSHSRLALFLLVSLLSLDAFSSGLICITSTSKKRRDLINELLCGEVVFEMSSRSRGGESGERITMSLHNTFHF